MTLKPLLVDRLRPHEATDPAILENLISELKVKGSLKDPIIVDRETLVILDGHHRHAAYKALGFKQVPCLLVDYRSPQVRVLPRRPEIPVSKEEVIRRGLQGELYPPKTTRHIFIGLALSPSLEQSPRFALQYDQDGL